MIEIEDVFVLIVDIQEKLLNAVFNKTEVEKNTQIIAKVTGLLNIPVVVTEQYPKGLGETIDSVKNNLKNAQYTEKTDFDALKTENFNKCVKELKKKQVIILGIETHICVYQTALSFIKKGYEVIIVANACGSRSEYEYKFAIDELRSQGAKIMTTEMIIFNLLKTSKHSNFKEIQALIK